MTRIAGITPWLVLLGIAAPAGAQSDASIETGYLTPPQAIVDILDAPPTPTVIVGPTRDVAVFVEQRSMPPISWLGRPMHRLAGYRIDPRNSGPWRAPEIAALTVVRLDVESGTRRAGADDIRVLAPRGTTLGWPSFSPDGSHLSYAVLRDTGIELWVVDLSTGQPRPLTSASLNATWGNPCEWLADDSGVLCRFRRSARGSPPSPPRQPAGPNVQEHDGALSPVRTYQDLLGQRPRRGAVRVSLHQPGRDGGPGHRIADRRGRAGALRARLGRARQPARARRTHRAALLVADAGEPLRPLGRGLDARRRRGHRGEASAGRQRADRRRRQRAARAPLEPDRAGHAGLERGAGRRRSAGGRAVPRYPVRARRAVRRRAARAGPHRAPVLHHRLDAGRYGAHHRDGSARRAGPARRCSIRAAATPGGCSTAVQKTSTAIRAPRCGVPAAARRARPSCRTATPSTWPATGASPDGDQSVRRPARPDDAGDRPPVPHRAGNLRDGRRGPRNGRRGRC